MLVDLIKSKKPKSVLLEFYHGLGDLVMFMPVVSELRRIFPDVSFRIGIESGIGFHDVSDLCVYATQEEISRNDLVFRVEYLCTEPNDRTTKTKRCCEYEIGITPPQDSHGVISNHKTPLVGVHFQSTCMPSTLSVKPQAAERIWRTIIECGLVPIELHFEHKWANPVNKPFKFAGCSVRGCKPNISSLVGIMHSCRGFIGVASGPFHIAMSVLPPERVMFVNEPYRAGCFTSLPVKTINPSNGLDALKPWLESL